MIDADASSNSRPAYRPALRIAGNGKEANQFESALRGIAVDARDRIHAVGDSAVKVFDGDGRLLGRWPTSRPGFCVTVGADGRVWVGEYKQVEIFDAAGELRDTWRDPDRLGLVTAIGLARGGDVFLADAHARWIRRYDEQGAFLNNIGDRHRKGGFHIPNGVVDFAIDADGVLHVANPGMHRVERYEAGGEYLGYFGKFDGRDPAGFPGCCNPTNVALDRAGRVVVSEKAGPRAKVYSREGQLLTVVAEEEFDREAKNMDVAVDSRGRIYVVDTVTLEICVFAQASAEATT